MAIDTLNLANTLLINDENNADILPSHILDDAPLLQRMTAVEGSNGNIHKYLRYTAAPAVGFRQINEGRELQSSTDTQVTVNLSILDCSFGCDVMLARASKLGVEGFITREAIRHLRAGMFSVEQFIFSGDEGAVSATLGPAGEFDGLNILYGDISTTGNIIGMVEDVDAANTGTASSYTHAYFLRLAEDAVSLVVGNGMSLTIDPTVIQGMPASILSTGGSTATVLPAYYTPINGYFGLQVGSLYDACRVVNIGTGAAGVRLDDDKLFAAISRFPSARQPNVCVMNRTALKQLRDSRTATNITGAPAPFPTDIGGVPIIVTDAIPNNLAFINATAP